MIAIIGAMQAEIENLHTIMSVENEVKKANMQFFIGELSDKKVILVKSGIGKVNAAICAQICIDLGADYVINTGIAGGITPNLKIGDVVLSTDLVHHDVDAISFGYKLGQIPQLDAFSFKADKHLLELAEKICKEKLIGYHAGRISTGDQFISDNEKKLKIYNNFSAFCTEMEGAAIAQASYLNDIPFIIIRSISDNADGNAHVDYKEFEKEAIKNSNSLVLSLIKEI